MFCTKCGKEQDENVKFCVNCGNSFTQSIDNNVNNKKQTNTQVITIIPSGTAPMIMGLLGLFGGFIPIVKYFTGLLSLLAIFIGISQRKNRKGAGLPTGKATAGIIMGLIAVIITIVSTVNTAADAVKFMNLFSSGSSSNSSNSSKMRRINYLTNNIPEEMQGTVWSNGKETVELGKNKIKLNDDWHRVNKILQDFNDKSYFLINFNKDQTITLYKMRLISLTRTGYFPKEGFMTLDELKADIEEKERIAKEIAGVWEGSFIIESQSFWSSSDGVIADMTLDISYQNNQFHTVLNFKTTNSRGSNRNISIPINSKGECLMDITYDKEEYHFNLTKWIINPFLGYHIKLAFTGKINDGVLSGISKHIDGNNQSNGRFNVKKK